MTKEVRLPSGAILEITTPLYVCDIHICWPEGKTRWHLPILFIQANCCLRAFHSPAFYIRFPLCHLLLERLCQPDLVSVSEAEDPEPLIPQHTPATMPSLLAILGLQEARTSPQVPAIIYNNPRMALRKDQKRRRRPIRPGLWRYAIDIHLKKLFAFKSDFLLVKKDRTFFRDFNN